MVNDVDRLSDGVRSSGTNNGDYMLSSNIFPNYEDVDDNQQDLTETRSSETPSTHNVDQDDSKDAKNSQAPKPENVINKYNNLGEAIIFQAPEKKITDGGNVREARRSPVLRTKNIINDEKALGEAINSYAKIIENSINNDDFKRTTNSRALITEKAIDYYQDNLKNVGNFENTNTKNEDSDLGALKKLGISTTAGLNYDLHRTYSEKSVILAPSSDPNKYLGGVERPSNTYDAVENHVGDYEKRSRVYSSDSIIDKQLGNIGVTSPASDIDLGVRLGVVKEPNKVYDSNVKVQTPEVIKNDSQTEAKNVSDDGIMEKKESSKLILVASVINRTSASISLQLPEVVENQAM